MTSKSGFALMDEPDRMVFIAQLHHMMWYDENCYRDVTKLMAQWKQKEIPEAILFPQENKLHS
jgi:hypothetical protein